jgi:hypothetical protein
MGSLGFHRDIARGAVKDDAVHGFENPKAFGNAIHLYIERAIHLWKFGEANPPAHGTKKTFNPMITGRHPTSMQSALASINVLFGCHNQIRKTWVPIASVEPTGQKNQARIAPSPILTGARGISAGADIHDSISLLWRLARRARSRRGHEQSRAHPVQAAVLIRPDVCFGAHYGLNSDIQLGPKGAK